MKRSMYVPISNSEKYYFFLLFSDEDVFHSIADGMDTMGKYVNTTLEELEDKTLGVYNATVDEVLNYSTN